VPRLMFYGGKGGVGKTTCAAARAAIEAVRGARVLLASTDPAHSLGHALGLRLSSVPRAIAISRGRRLSGRAIDSPRRAGSLHALELNARRAFGRWLSRNRGPLADVLEHGTWLDRGDIDALLELPLPGVDELSGILEIARFAGLDADGMGAVKEPKAGASRSPAAYDLVVIDTAPTGHTLRLLASPQAVGIVAQVLDDLQEDYRIVRERFARVRRAEAGDRLIAMLAAQSRRITELLRDPEQTAFHWVTLPEMLSLAESEDGIAAIERGGMRVAEVVLNRVLPAGAPCPVCDRRRADERGVLRLVARRLARGRRMCILAEELNEPQGTAALVRIGRSLIDGGRPDAKSTSSGSGSSGSRDERDASGQNNLGRAGPKAGPYRSFLGSRTSVVSGFSRTSQFVFSLSPGAPVVAAETLAAIRDASIVFFAGKGGVGKTTVAAAAAVRIARANPDRQVLLLSTDPAHSLADVLNLANGVLGDEPRPLPQGPANLQVRELDAIKALAARRSAIESALDDIASSFGASGVQHGAELMDLAPPGIDELFGMLSLVGAVSAFQTIAVDMAPTGHALRLLEQPDAARQWVQALIRVLLKYRSLARPGQLAQELVNLSRSIRELQALLNDPSRAHVIAITRAADLPRLETERLLAELGRLRLAMPLMVVNAMTLAPGRCPRCRHVAAAERRELARLQRGRPAGRSRCAIIQTPLSAPPPRGIAALEHWGGRWIAMNAAAQSRRPVRGAVSEQNRR
jgi:arsenite/tail-anchored protein-transporting ATPase